MRNRLPTLHEVLTRESLPPVDLLSFCIHLRNLQVEEYLDFWLDVQQHLALCRVYVKELRRTVLIDAPEETTNIVQHHGAVESDLVERFKLHQVKNDSGVRRSDLKASAEHILHKYILPGAEQELRIPDRIALDIQLDAQEKITNQGRDDLEVFEQARDYIFQAMEGHYPSFLREKALGNLSMPGCLVRLMLGLLGSLGGISTGLVFIVTHESRHIRLWVIISFILGVYFLVAHEYRLDPILALAGYSETRLFSFSRIREPYIRSLLIKRTITGLALFFVFAASLSVIYVFIPVKPL